MKNNLASKLQLSIFDVHYPLRRKKSGRDTSRAAATFIGTVIAPNLRERVYEELKIAPGSTDQVAERLEITVLSARPRFTELVRLGLIEDTGRRHINESGRSAIIWQVVQ